MDTVVKGKLKLKGGKVTKPGSAKKQSTRYADALVCCQCSGRPQ